jgi:retinol dehydrogenase 12
MPTLLSTARVSDIPARIVNVVSSGALMYGGLNFDTFKDTPARRKLGKEALYLRSKFGNIVVAQELARRYGDQGIVATSLNPGPIDTGLHRHVNSRLQKFFVVRLIVMMRTVLMVYNLRHLSTNRSILVL